MIDVYGTLGPSCASAEVLTQMFLAGMTGVRLNLSHVSLRESEGLLNVLHDAAQRAGVKPLLLVDLQGPELRIGPMGKPAELREDEEVRLCSEEAFSLSCSGEGAPSSPGYGTSSCSGEGASSSPGCGTSVCAKNTEVLLDDGRLLLRVTKTGEESAFARVVRGGRLTGRKSIKVPGADIRLPAMTKADRQNVRDALGCGVTGIMQPFVRSREDLEEVRGVLAENGAQKLQLVAKIENRAGMDQLAELLPACDAVCIARGDLGNDMRRRLGSNGDRRDRCRPLSRGGHPLSRKDGGGGREIQRNPEQLKIMAFTGQSKIKLRQKSFAEAADRISGKGKRNEVSLLWK